VYALSHPSWGHWYRLSPGVADLDRDFVTRLTGVGGDSTSILALFAAGGWGDRVEGPASYSMSNGESMGAGLLCTAAILL
jgi:hypothetical protein